MPILYLLLAHLLADFTLQSSKLIQWKRRTWVGIFVHVLIFYGLSLLFLFPYLNSLQNWGILTALAGSHFILDQSKITLQKYTRKFQQEFFIIDQVIHFLLLLLAANSLTTIGIQWPDSFFYNKIYLNVRLISYASILILLTYTYDLVSFLKKNDFHPKKEYHPNYRGFAWRIFIFSVIYGIFILVRT